MNLFHQFLHYCIYPWIMILCVNLYLSESVAIPPKQQEEPFLTSYLNQHSNAPRDVVPTSVPSQKYFHDHPHDAVEYQNHKLDRSLKSENRSQVGQGVARLGKNLVGSVGAMKKIKFLRKNHDHKLDRRLKLNEREPEVPNTVLRSSDRVASHMPPHLPSSTTTLPAIRHTLSTYAPYTLPTATTIKYRSNHILSNLEEHSLNLANKMTAAASKDEVAHDEKIDKGSLHNALYPFVPDLGRAASPLFMHFAGQALHHITKRSIPKKHNRRNSRRSTPFNNSASESSPSSSSAHSVSGDTANELNNFIRNRGRECETNPESSSPMFTCPSLDINGRYVCIEESQLCNKEYNCPLGEDEDGVACLFRKTMLLHIKQLIDVFMEINRI